MLEVELPKKPKMQLFGMLPDTGLTAFMWLENLYVKMPELEKKDLTPKLNAINLQTELLLSFRSRKRSIPFC
jgi:hypothetical protein